MKLLQALAISLPLALLLAFDLWSGRARRHLALFVTLAGIWLFDCAGSAVVIYNPSLYSDAYVYSMLLVNMLCFAGYAFVLAWGRRGEVTYEHLHVDTPFEASLLFLVVVWCYAAAMFTLYYSRHGLPPLFSLSEELAYVDLYAVRMEKTTNLPEGMHWYVHGMQTMPYLGFSYAYALMLLRRTRRARLLFGVCALATAVVASFFANKSVILQMLVLVAIVRMYAGDKSIRVIRTALYAGLGAASVFLALRLYLLDRSWRQVLVLFRAYLLHRFLSVYAEAHAYVVQIFPRETAYLGGLGLPNPGGLLPYTPVNLSQMLGYRVHGTLTNYAAPAFSHGFANFGWWGIAGVMAFIFVATAVFQAIFRRLPQTPLVLAIYALLVSRMVMYGAADVQTVFAPDLLVLLMAFVMVHWALRVLFRPLHAPARRLPHAITAFE